MSTTRELCEVLAAALGVERAVVKSHAHALHEVGLFPSDEADADEAHAEPEHAAALLVAIMGGGPPEKSPDAVRLYANLPLDRVHWGVTRPNGGWETGEIPAGDSYFEDIKTYGSAFGECLTCFIGWFAKTTEIDCKVLRIFLGGGLGNATAAIFCALLIENVNVVSEIKFSLQPLGGGAVPDDAPRARLDRSAVIPGAILPILREFFTGAPGGPREVFMSRADLARLSQGA